MPQKQNILKLAKIRFLGIISVPLCSFKANVF